VPALTSARVRRVGHKGAEHIVPGNTVASFDAGIAAGVDMIEFDVVPDPSGTLVLAHDPHDAATRAPLTLAEGLAHLAGEAFAEIELLVDVKGPGYESRVLDALREHDVVHRSLLCTQLPRSLAVLRAHEPGLRLGWSVPRLTRDPFRSPFTVAPAWLGLQAMRVGLPGRAEAAIRRGYCTAVMAHWRLLTRALVTRVREAGGELYVWTVDDAEQIRALAGLGVTGIITNDPRLFAVLDSYSTQPAAE
jgi:glycerophosphoryl diester phosphodiesterase